MIESGSTGFDFPAHERRLVERRRLQPDLSAALQAVEALASFIVRAPLADKNVASDAPSEELRPVAALQLCTLTVRSASAAVVLIRHGHEPEVDPMLRRIEECANALQLIEGDRSGVMARKWLEGRFPAPGSVADRLGVGRRLKRLHPNSHADRMGIAWLFNPPVSVPVRDEKRSIDIRPRRLVHHSKAMLHEITYMCGFVAAGLAACTASAFPMPPDLANYLLARKLGSGAADPP